MTTNTSIDEMPHTDPLDAFFRELDSPDSEELNLEPTEKLRISQRHRWKSSNPYSEEKTQAPTYYQPDLQEFESVLTSSGIYRILSIIGAGGMGTVYSAVEESSGEYVAIKQIPKEAEESQSKRFEREAEALSSFDHPNISRFYKFDAESRTLVMELLKGNPLSNDHGKKSAKEIAQFCTYALQVLGALNHVHSKGYLHRDIKPANIVVEDEQAHLVDFGLVGYDLDSGLALTPQSVNITQTGHVMGTPLFMSPEQVLSERLTPRSDIYNLGATLYTLLTGYHPFEASCSMGVMNKIISTHPDEPAHLNRRISQNLNSLLLRTLSKVPSRRPDIDGFSETLERVIDAYQR